MHRELVTVLIGRICIGMETWRWGVVMVFSGGMTKYLKFE